ncbi:MAG: DUF362 domain-containing protein [Candidatus Bathyarchaeia archaeon]
MPSEVLFIRVKQQHGGVQEAVKAAMMPLWKNNLLHGSKIFVKVNLISSEFVPGQCTSPLVLDEVLKELTERGYEVTFGDADLAAAQQCDKAYEVWGHKKIAEKYGARFQNLSKDRLVNVEVGGVVFKTLDVPQCILEADLIINLPVIKTHCLTGLTCALKHFWGVVPRVRHQYHLVVNDAIADITYFLKDKIVYNIADGTIAMEGDGPRTGKPKICNVVMASSDPVALDAAVAEYMGISIPEHVVAAAKRGVGLLDYLIVGDDFKPDPFLQANPYKQPIFKWEMAFRKSFLKPLIFDTSIFSIFAWIATKYNTFWYFRRRGKKYRKQVEETWYGEEFKEFFGSEERR